MRSVNAQTNGNYPQFAGHYRHDLIVWRMTQLGLSANQTALKTKKGKKHLSSTSISNAMSGACRKMETLWDIARALGLKWEYLFKLDLPENQFHRAVLSGDSDSVR